VTLPTAAELYATVEATWPPASTRSFGPWVIRDGGGGGGKRVSAATAQSDFDEQDIAQAEAAMADLNQPNLFMIREGDVKLMWSGKFGQHAKMYPTRTNGYENDETTKLFRQV